MKRFAPSALMTSRRSQGTISNGLHRTFRLITHRAMDALVKFHTHCAMPFTPVYPLLALSLYVTE